MPSRESEESQENGDIDDSGDPLVAFQRTLEADLARGEVSFPTFVDAAVRVRSALNDPDIDVDRLARIISAEPLLAARLVRMANSAAMSRGSPVRNVKAATMRLGFTIVRATAVAVALEQLKNASELARFRQTAVAAWRHSIEVAAIACVLARRFTGINPDEALFAGLVHDIGRFYLLSRLAREPHLHERPTELDAIVSAWHAPLGEAVLQTFGLPESILEAIARHEDREFDIPPADLVQVVTLANLLALQGGRQTGDADPEADARLSDPRLVSALVEATVELTSLIDALSGR